MIEPVHARSRCRAAVHGQALIEALVALSVLLLVYGAVARVGAWQESALRASQASRHAAFLATRGAPLPKDRDIDRRQERSRRLPDPAQPGARDAYAGRLRGEWSLQDQGIVRLVAAIRSPAWASVALPGAVPGDVPAGSPRFERQTAILADDGHSSDDHAAQRRVGRSATAWGQPARRSTDLGRSLGASMEGVDAAWERPAPDFDWLDPWAGLVPDRYLESAPRGWGHP